MCENMSWKNCSGWRSSPAMLDSLSMPKLFWTRRMSLDCGRLGHPSLCSDFEERLFWQRPQKHGYPRAQKHKNAQQHLENRTDHLPVINWSYAPICQGAGTRWRPVPVLMPLLPRLACGGHVTLCHAHSPFVLWGLGVAFSKGYSFLTIS